MRIYRLAHQLVMRFSAMDESEALELNGEAQQAYNDALHKAKAKEIQNNSITEENARNAGVEGYKKKELLPLTMHDKLILWVEKWYPRYGFAILYIILVPQIRNYINGEQGEENEADSELADMLSFYEKYKRFKKS